MAVRFLPEIIRCVITVGRTCGFTEVVVLPSKDDVTRSEEKMKARELL